MTLVMPEGVPVLGQTAVMAVVTIADATAPKLATEINAASSKNISLHLSGAGWSPGGTTAKGQKPPRLGSSTQSEIFNRTTYSIATLSYVYDPQGATSDPINVAKTLLTEGTKIHLLERLGLDADTLAWAVSQKTRDHYVRLGPQIPGPADRSDENAEFVIMQDVVYVSPAGPTDGVIAT